MRCQGLKATYSTLQQYKLLIVLWCPSRQIKGEFSVDEGVKVKVLSPDIFGGSSVGPIFQGLS